jgi:uncharacterized protein YqeY
MDYYYELKRKEQTPMNKYESIKADMTSALKNGDKLRRLTLADMVATIDKAATSGKMRVEITDAFVDEVLLKYKKTVQEMVDTCPDTEKYAEKKAEYLMKLTIAAEYAPKVIDDSCEIEKLILNFACENNLTLTKSNKGAIMKAIMPFLKQNNCDMKVANGVLNKVIV